MDVWITLSWTEFYLKRSWTFSKFHCSLPRLSMLCMSPVNMKQWNLLDTGILGLHHSPSMRASLSVKPMPELVMELSWLRTVGCAGGTSSAESSSSWTYSHRTSYSSYSHSTYRHQSCHLQPLHVDIGHFTYSHSMYRHRPCHLQPFHIQTSIISLTATPWTDISHATYSHSMYRHQSFNL